MLLLSQHTIIIVYIGNLYSGNHGWKGRVYTTASKVERFIISYQLSLLLMIENPTTRNAHLPESHGDFIILLVQLLRHAIANGLFSLFTEQCLMKV